MRRPPTRGPQDPWTPRKDPWTPRKIALRGHLCEPLPRRPTLDGPAHNVRLHGPYAGGRGLRCISVAFAPAIGGLLFMKNLPFPL